LSYIPPGFFILLDLCEALRPLLPCFCAYRTLLALVAVYYTPKMTLALLA
jgi:hypothetical protein